MALKKEIQLENGITVNYHRIVSINKITNIRNIIEVASYTSEEKREEEKDYYKPVEEVEVKLIRNEDDEEEEILPSSPGFPKEKNITMNVFIDTTFVGKDYNPNETIEDAYNYLKTTEKFKDAENS